MTADPFPIDAGYCIKRTDDNHCVDLHRHPGEWRVVLTERANEVHPHDHAKCPIVAAWSYPVVATESYSVYLTALAAARAFDGTGEPPGYHKRLIG